MVNPRDGRPHEGYRDENASLVAENARLRTEIERLRGGRRRLWPAAAVLASDFAAVLLLRPWFNGGSDAKFWAAVTISLALAISATAFALVSVPNGRR
jgi:hypothetical protein